MYPKSTKPSVVLAAAKVLKTFMWIPRAAKEGIVALNVWLRTGPSAGQETDGITTLAVTLWLGVEPYSLAWEICDERNESEHALG